VGSTAGGGSGGTDPSSLPGAGNGGSAGAALPADDVPVDFFRDIQPILGDYCVRCHGGVRELPLAGGAFPPLNLQSREKAAHVLGEAGNPESSRLYIRVVTENPEVRMPLGQQAMPADKINKLRRWIFQGAPWPTQWSFAPIVPVDPASIAVSNEAWVKSPVDRFVLSRLDQAVIAPSPEASRETLIRRLSLDITGLPPTPAEVDAFVADASATAYESLVDRLLASPAYGERWARHWLDQARYADSDGYEKDGARPNAWRWRDWVMDSLNRDQPFDDFTVEQVAGDIMPGATPLQTLGTGFHRNTLLNTEGGSDPEEDRSKRLIDRVATVGQTWLGLTLGCTQCHSHPYDPIEHTDFDRMLAFFNNADEVMLSVPRTEAGPDTMPADVMSERTQGFRPTDLFVRGNFLTPDMTQELSGASPAVLPPMTPRGARADRLDLANWLVSPANPLTSRVAVNTVWSHLFGAGLVGTLEDFGARSHYPSHPELLDWLASEFVKVGWSRKALIRLVVTSASYRQASAFVPAAELLDPENALLHRQNRLRVEAEIIGDLYLAASGLLSAKRGGPTVYPPIPQEVQDLGYSDLNWPTSVGEDRYRRGLYTFHKRTILHPNLQIFDRPSAGASQNGRARTNTPLQALTTLNNPVFVEAAQALGRRVQAEAPGSLSNQLTLAFRLALSRTPSAGELATLTSLHGDARASFAANEAAAVSLVATYLPPSVPLADAAAWVVTARTILNLDEVITRE